MRNYDYVCRYIIVAAIRATKDVCVFQEKGKRKL